jgi:hypothetical protein
MVARFHFRVEREVVDTFLEDEEGSGFHRSCLDSCHDVSGLPLLVCPPREPICAVDRVSWMAVWKSRNR